MSRLVPCKDDRERDTLILVACLVSIVMIIIIDALSPVGVATGVLYIIPVGLTMFSRGKRITYAVALVSSVLDPLGYFIAPPGAGPYYALLNRFIGLIAILVMAAIIIQKKGAKARVDISNEAIKESEQRFHSTLDNMIEGCQIIGRDWRYIYINEAAEKQNQRPMEELLGNRYMDMWPGIESTKVFIVLRRCMEERFSGNGERVRLSRWNHRVVRIEGLTGS